MEKEFIPYEQALALKELGFDEECFSYYNTTEMLISSEFLWRNSYSKGTDVVAPLYQQAFRWFREKYNLISDIQYYGDWNFEILRLGEFAELIDDVNVDYTFIGGTHEEAELECLKKLIEIVKEK